MSIPFRDAWRRKDDLLNARVALSGGLFIGDDAFISIDFDSCLAGVRFYLCDGGRIREHLLTVLPAMGGGPFIYCEKVEVTGTIEHDEFGFQLTGLKDCVVTGSSDGTRVDVPL